MLDPRIYRTGLVAVALAVIVFAFSLENQPGGYGTTLAPDAFNGQNAYSTMASLAQAVPSRRPGSAGDAQVADYVVRKLRGLGYSVKRDGFTAHTAAGQQALENVTGVLAGSSNSTIVVVAHRDAMRAPATADLSGTGVLLELARVLAGETEHHTIVFASTSAAAGAAGTSALVRSLPRPVDAVLVLGDLAGTRALQPIIASWAYGSKLAPPALINTVGAAVRAQSPLAPQRGSLAGSILRLAFPMTVSEQAPLDRGGLPAVSLSLSGERTPAAGAQTSPGTLTAMGRAALQSIDALDGARDVPRPSGYLIYDRKIIPAWSLSLLVLALIAPVLLSALDGLARARRRGHEVLPWLVWVLSCAGAFALAVPVITGARVVGILSDEPGGPIPAGVPISHAAIWVTVAVAAAAVILALSLVRPRLARLAGSHHALERAASQPGAAIAVILVLSVIALVLWIVNPYAALLLVPALHAWMWLAAGLALARPLKFLLAAIGVAVPVLAALYYALALKLSVVGVLTNGVLAVGFGQMGTAAALLWAAALGCLWCVVVLALSRSPRAHAEPVPITMRGPLSYAGPGSLGGTESALRR